MFGSQQVEDFYVRTEEELEQWLDYLYMYMIITDLNEDYLLIETIGAGSCGRVYRAR